MNSLNPSYPERRYFIHLDIMNEEMRQDAKWGARRSFPNGTARYEAFAGMGDAEIATYMRQKCKANTPETDNWRDILEEEVYEAFAEDEPVRLRQELVQCAAVIAQWIADLDRKGAG